MTQEEAGAGVGAIWNSNAAQARRYVWLACLLGVVGLIAATMALGDLVQRSQLRGWSKTTGEIVRASDGEIAVRVRLSGDATDVPLPGWVGADRDVGDRVETWVHPRNSGTVILAGNTPLYALPVAGPIAVLAAAVILWLLSRSKSLRRDAPAFAQGRDQATPAPAPNAPGEWLAAAAVPMAICLGSLGWLAANPEIQGDLQLGLAGLMYLAAMFGVRKWLRADLSRLDQRGSDAA